MQHLWWVIIFAAEVLASSPKCGKYNCVAGNEETCIRHSKKKGYDVYDLSICPKEEYCPNDAKKDQKCQAYEPEPNFNYPGELCTYNSDCISGVCEGNACQGTPLNYPCINPWECNPGLYCDLVENLCLPQLPVGKKCLYPDMCVNSAVCMSSVCTQIFSAPINTTFNDVEVDPSGFNMACDSGFAYEKAGIYICAQPPVSNGPLPVTCEPDTKCISKDGKYAKNCTCGYNSRGDAFCPLFEGDEYVQTMIQDWSILSTLNENCNSYNRWSYQCFALLPFSAQQAYYNWASNYTLYFENYWPLVQGNQNNICIQSIYTSLYWDLLANSHGITQRCPVYYCTPPNEEWEKDQCIVYAKETNSYAVQEALFINPCSDDKVCEPTRFTNSTCQSYNATLKYPGDYCTSGHECTSGHCKSLSCQGLSLNAQCVYLYDCNPGLYCDPDTQTCQAQIQPGKNCSIEYQCQNNYVCNLGICTLYYSLAIGAEVDQVDYHGYSSACTSGFATIPTGSTNYVCAVAPVSSKTVSPCIPGGVCYDSTNTYQKECACGYSEYGYSYCPPFEGDSYLQNAILSFKSLSTAKVNCNTLSRKSANCYMKYSDYIDTYYDFILNFTFYQQYPLLQFNPDCVKSIYTSEYWTLLERKHVDSSSSISFVSILLAFILIN